MYKLLIISRCVAMSGLALAHTVVEFDSELERDVAAKNVIEHPDNSQLCNLTAIHL